MWALLTQPVGSCAGPLMLYSGYASTMQEIVLTDIDIHGYADDHVLNKSFGGSSRIEEYAIADTKSWMDENRLKMNIEKQNSL